VGSEMCIRDRGCSRQRVKVLPAVMASQAMKRKASRLPRSLRAAHSGAALAVFKGLCSLVMPSSRRGRELTAGYNGVTLLDFEADTAAGFLEVHQQPRTRAHGRQELGVVDARRGADFGR
jgi:hypothetical protein